MQPAASVPVVVSGRPTRARTSLVVVTAVLSAVFLFVAVAVAAPVDSLAATPMIAACDDVNLRTAPRTSGSVKGSLRAKTAVTVTAKVSGGSWRISCGGRTVSGSTWYRIGAVNGTSVAARYGVGAVFAATGLLAPAASNVSTSATTTRAAACAANLRTSPSTGARLRRTIQAGARVTVTATVSGRAWRASCGGKTVTGTKWYRISAIGGRSVRSLYGVSALYAATGLFRAAPPAPTPPAPPATTTLFAACNDVNVRSTASTGGALRTTLDAAHPVTVVGTVAGGAWSATCGGRTVSGTAWYRIVSIGGRSTAALHGATQLFAAKGLFSATKPPAPAPMPAPVPTVPVTAGIDVSHWQGPINWAKVAAAGKKFVFLKASEDVDFVDRTYATNRAGARAAGLLVGAYHFARPDAAPGDAIAEADHFVDTARVARGDLLPILDIEVTGGLPAAALRDWAATFLGRVHERTGVRGAIYASPVFWAGAMGNTPWFANAGYPIWTAHWTSASSPSVPAGNWGGKGWTFWQYSETGTVAGIAGRVDLNFYRGTDLSRVRVP